MTSYKKIHLAQSIIKWILIGGMILAFLLPFSLCYAEELDEFAESLKTELFYYLQIFLLICTPISFMQFWTGVALIDCSTVAFVLYFIAFLPLLGILLAKKRIWVYRILVYSIFGINRIFDLLCLEFLVNGEGMIDYKSILFITPGILYMLLAIALDVLLHYEKKLLAKENTQEVQETLTAGNP